MRGLITKSNEPLTSHENIKSIIEALSSSDFEDIKVAITTLKNTLCDKNVVEKVKRFEENRKNSTTFQFLMKYKNVVTILFNFINSSQSRNWVAHLNALEEIIPYVSAMDRMKYGRMLPGYLSDIFFLIGIHSMRGYTATTRHGVTRKKKHKMIKVYKKSI